MKTIDEVRKFQKHCMDTIGNYASETFDVKLFHKITESNIESPIEQILLSALCLIKWITSLNVLIEPQKKIGNFRVDFFIKAPSNAVVVECDSQQFHERTEEERRYEKKRDRFLQKEGYKVFRFTGKEILKIPIEISIEILAYVIGVSEDELMGQYDNYRGEYE